MTTLKIPPDIEKVLFVYGPEQVMDAINHQFGLGIVYRYLNIHRYKKCTELKK